MTDLHSTHVHAVYTVHPCSTMLKHAPNLKLDIIRSAIKWGCIALMIIEVRSPRDRPVGVKHAYHSSASRASDGCCTRTRAIFALIGDGYAEQDYNQY